MKATTDSIKKLSAMMEQAIVANRKNPAARATVREAIRELRKLRGILELRGAQ